MRLRIPKAIAYGNKTPGRGALFRKTRQGEVGYPPPSQAWRDREATYQVEAWLAGPGRALHAMIRFIAQVLSPLGRFHLRPARPVSANPC
jgi:hypothetical protein